MLPLFRRLDDLRKQNLNAFVSCDWCGHSGVIDGTLLWRWFAIHTWDDRAESVRQRMRCSICKRRSTAITATEAPPGSDSFFPQSEDEWKRAVQRLRG